MASGQINSATVISADCDDMILCKDMGSVQSAVVRVNPEGTE